MSSCVAITCGLSAAGSRGAVASAAQQRQQQQRLRDATPPVEEQGEGVSQAAGECLLLSGVGPTRTLALSASQTATRQDVDKRLLMSLLKTPAAESLDTFSQESLVQLVSLCLTVNVASQVW